MSLYSKRCRISACCLILAMLLCGCKQEAAESVELLDPIEYVETTYTVVAKDVEAYHVNTAASLQYRTEGLYFPEGGTVGNAAVSIGDTVKKGDLIVALDLDAVQAEYERLSDAIGQMKTNHSYTLQQLELDHSIAKLQLQLAEEQGKDAYEIAQLELAVEAAALAIRQQKEKAQADLSGLENQRAEYEQQLENSRIYAPFDGIVTYLPDTTLGKVYLTDEQPAAILMDDSQVTVCIDYLSKQRLAKYQRFTACINGIEYPLSLQSQSEEEIKQLQLQGKSVDTVFAFADEQPKQLEGAIVALNMYYASYQDVLTVPYQAVMQDAGTYSVYLQIDGKKSVRYIKVEAFTATEAIVSSGLQEGDVVYVN